MKDFFQKIAAFFKAADKQLHILASYAIALTVFIFFAAFKLDWLGFGAAIVVSAGAAALKEWYDYKHPDKHECDWKDVVADAIGIVAAIGAMLFYLLN